MLAVVKDVICCAVYQSASLKDAVNGIQKMHWGENTSPCFKRRGDTATGTFPPSNWLCNNADLCLTTVRGQSDCNLMLSCSFSHTFCFVFGEICLYCNGHLLSEAGELVMCWYFLCGQFTVAFSEHTVVFSRKQLITLHVIRLNE
jgi:hypothetical protein